MLPSQQKQKQIYSQNFNRWTKLQIRLIVDQRVKVIKFQTYNSLEQIMTYRATLQIVITLNQLYLFNLRKQGQVRFKMTLFQKQTTENDEKKKITKEQLEKQQNHIYCNPYNIARKVDIKNNIAEKLFPATTQGLRNFSNPQFYQQQNTFMPPRENNPYKLSGYDRQPTQASINNSNLPKTQSLIDYEGESYFSRVFDTKFAQETHKIEESVFFKCYIPVDSLNNTSLTIKVELLFSPEQQNKFKLLGSFKGKIRKLSPISSYMPISFDQFEGFTICATYHTTIMQFKFEQLEQQSLLLNKTYEQFASFQLYLKAATSSFRRAETKNFYFYYREFLEKELFDLQERHSDLIRILGLSNQIDYRFIKIACNSQILSILNGLPIFANDKSIDSSTQFALIQCFLQDFLQLKALIYEKWNNFVIFMTEYIEQITEYYRQIYQKNLKQRFKGNVFSHRIECNHDWTFSKYEDSGKKYEEMADNDRKKMKEEELWSELFPIEDQNCFQDQKTFIKMFEQIYPVKREKRQIPAVKKFNLSSYSQLQQSQNASQNIYLTGRQRQPNQQNYPIQTKFIKPTLLNMRKSSMVTTGETDPITFKQKTIELGSTSTGLSRSQSLKEKYDSAFSFETGKQKRINQNSYQTQNDKGQHIIVLVHGYQASRQDFQVLKLCLEIRFKAKVFISNANEGRTEDNVQAMGKRLAIQLVRYFQNVDFTPNTRVSFIGHSLGGVIIRSALGFMQNITQYLYTYISFSSPHLGYLYEPSRLVKAGLWIMNSWQGSKCLNEICMKDTEDLRMSYFFRLSQNKALNGFKKIVLISSSQDGYIPYESARIQKNSDILYNKLGDSISRNVIIEMVDNLLGDVDAEEISRINVIFHIEDRNMDSLIGRTAHIKYLSDLKFIKMFFIVFQKFFV